MRLFSSILGLSSADSVVKYSFGVQVEPVEQNETHT